MPARPLCCATPRSPIVFHERPGWAHSEGWAAFLKRIISVRRDARDVLQLHIRNLWPGGGWKIRQNPTHRVQFVYTHSRALACFRGSWIPNGAHLITFRDFLDFGPRTRNPINLIAPRETMIYGVGGDLTSCCFHHRRIENGTQPMMSPQFSFVSTTFSISSHHISIIERAIWFDDLMNNN